MVKIRIPVFGILLFAFSALTCALAVQDDDVGQKYAKMTDAELWALVKKCRTKDELVSLINLIPISVLADHAISELKSSKETKFGKLVVEVLWPDFDYEKDAKQINRILRWENSTRRFSTMARIFDVQVSSVILAKVNGSLSPRVPVDKLSPYSKSRLESYRQFRKSFRQRLPADMAELLSLFETPRGSTDAWPEKLTAVIAFRSVNELIADGSYLLGAAGLSKWVPVFEKHARENSEGINRHQAFGTILSLKKNQAQVVFCLPVKDFYQVKKLLTSYGFDSEREGIFHRFDLPVGEKVFALSKGGWAFFSNSKSSLARLPAFPGKIFKPHSIDYTISVSVKIQRLLDSWRKASKVEKEKYFDEFLGQEGWGALLSQSVRGGVSTLVKAFGVKGLAYHNAGDIVQEIDQLTVGLAFDAKRKRTFLDFSIFAVKDSLLSKRLAAAGSATSKFKGFAREKATVEIHAVANLLDEDRKHLLSLIKEVETRIEKRTWHGKVAGQLMVILNSVIESGRIDLAGSLLLKEDSVDCIIGFQVPDGPDIEKIIGELMSTIEEGYKDHFDLKLNAIVDTENRVTFHTLVIAIPEEQEDARIVFGDEAHFVIGNGPGAIYVGVGKNAVESIKSGISVSRIDDGKELAGMGLKLKLQPLAKFAARFEEKWRWRFLFEDIADWLRKSGKDGITADLEINETSQRIRIEAEEGILGLYHVAYWGWFLISR